MNAAVTEMPRRPANEVRALVNYTRNTGVRPVNYTFDPPPGVSRNSGEVDARMVTIHDARAARGFSLDVGGFELITHRSSLRAFADFQDAATIAYQDTAVSGQIIEDASETDALAHTWDTLRLEALPRAASLTLIEETARQWT